MLADLDSKALDQRACFSRESVHDLPRIGGVGSGGEVLDCGPVLGDQLETVLGSVDGLLPVGEELFGALVGLVPGDVSLLGELGQR
ncbi:MULTISPECIES: hypothetical protein [unclassified Streptomyces]|uniref:hypothetical protein n=1 Tax=unclassified Streptomyces TaxID=2593676 RepID=UPI0008DDF73E|nr:MULTISPECIES: hypothetical protein [unclassified Streptomyces]OII66201.1 hypothetical protein BJP39_08805 [Streptomyces sp. CC77]